MTFEHQEFILSINNSICSNVSVVDGVVVSQDALQDRNIMNVTQIVSSHLAGIVLYYMYVKA